MNAPVLTLAPHENSREEIRAKALLFADIRSQQLLEQAELVAASPVPVLIHGETGTGKELLARHLHKRSGRKGPFVAVNGAAINESLAESEFFGHEAGAFTGANGRREGWFEAAQGGTLFLDEIGDLPLALQVKLLRVLQEREVVRVGGRKPIPIDVRIVTATHVDLQSAITAGRFREDLYYRLNIVTLRIPPLRDRPGDILPLARHFLGQFAREHARPLPELNADAVQRLLAHSWPGNIRELENTLLSAALLAGGPLIEGRHLQFSRRAAPAPAPTTTAGAPPNNAGAPTDPLWQGIRQQLQELLDHEHPELLARWEELLVETTLARHHFNQVHSADRLGISRHALRTLMKRYDLLPPPTGARYSNAG
ncbi:sigma-54 dependent transcriptional regulator [Pseudomonas sp. AN-1]|uniref:sigma-54 interaction domain-containing protein n=1 Tax=Pseudomonas sp. AN-1 TaxID=3096605 RepID=UPI002A6A0E30|nr:sigma-54 dependent transcriptional regulator [Pseudomonas sp. AN-1]WPP47062.1 sigma-54 dependent transcriptional regulator [Pseudomonas sp. AN-1]